MGRPVGGGPRAACRWHNPRLGLALGRRPLTLCQAGIAVASVSFIRSTLLPAAIVLLFGLALFAVSARIWLPGDMSAPAMGG